jgi:hypothetical protein
MGTTAWTPNNLLNFNVRTVIADNKNHADVFTLHRTYGWVFVIAFPSPFWRLGLWNSEIHLFVRFQVLTMVRYPDYSHLGRDAVYFGTWVPIFQGDLLPYLQSRSVFYPKDETPDCSKIMFVTCLPNCTVSHQGRPKLEFPPSTFLTLSGTCCPLLVLHATHVCIIKCPTTHWLLIMMMIY